MREDLWGAAKTALERVPTNPPGTEALTRRARTIRTRRYAVAGLALVLVGAGLFYPLRLLSRLGTQPERDRFGPGSSGASPISEEQQSFRPGWFAHVDTKDRVRIDAPRDWVYREDPTILHEPKVLFGLGSWNVPSYWEGEACGSDSVLSFLPDSEVLVWVEEFHGASIPKDFASLEAPPRLDDLFPTRSYCVPQQQVHSLGFRLDGRSFVISVALGERSLASLRTTVDEVLATFRTRIDEEPFPPEPIGPVVELATGTAFGGTWSLSAYWTEMQGKDVVCYQVLGSELGSGSGCDDPQRFEPKAGSYLQATYVSSKEERGVRSETFFFGAAWKGVAGITISLDDGRVLTSQTLKSKKLPVAFYVIPFEGDAQVVTVEALDADGNVLEEQSLVP